MIPHEERTAATVIAFSPVQAKAICPRCGTHLTVFGIDPRITAAAAADVHDIECANLRAAAALLSPPVDNDDELAAAAAQVASLVSAGRDRIKAAALGKGVS